MARTKRSANLGSRSPRLNLQKGKKHYDPLATGLSLIYYRPKSDAAGSWGVCYVDPVDGIQKQKGLNIRADDYQDADGVAFLNFTQAQVKAQEFYQKVINQADGSEGSTGEIDIAKFTVGYALEAYFKEKERPGAKGGKGISIVKQCANAWIIPELGSIPLAKLTKARLNDWLDYVATSGRRIGGKLGPPPQTDEQKRQRRDSANRILSILKAALTLAYNENDNLAEAISPCWHRVKPYAGVSKARPMFLKEDEEIRLINACESDFRELVIGALETGCRYGELAGVRVKDYNPDSEIPTLYIDASISKSGKPRYVDIGSERGVALFDEITARKRSQNDLLFTHKAKRLTRGDARKLKSYTEKRMDRAKMSREEQAKIVLEGFEDAWRPSDQDPHLEVACQRAGIEDMDFHALRHTHASMLIRGGASLSYVAAQLGHCDTRMVEKYYGHLVPDDKARAIRAAKAGRGRLDEPKFQKLKIRKPKAG
jgi:integrase